MGEQLETRESLSPAERAVHDRFRSLGCWRGDPLQRCLDPDDVEDCAFMACEAIDALTKAGHLGRTPAADGGGA